MKEWFNKSAVNILNGLKGTNFHNLDVLLLSTLVLRVYVDAHG